MRRSSNSRETALNVLRLSDLVARGDVAGKRVFIRADLNVPQDHSPEGRGRITEDTRIRASLKCIRMALDAGAAVMVTSHLGRPTEGTNERGVALVAHRRTRVAERPLELHQREGSAAAPAHRQRGDGYTVVKCSRARAAG